MTFRVHILQSETTGKVTGSPPGSEIAVQWNPCVLYRSPISFRHRREVSSCTLNDCKSFFQFVPIGTLHLNRIGHRHISHISPLSLND